VSAERYGVNRSRNRAVVEVSRQPVADGTLLNRWVWLV